MHMKFHLDCALGGLQTNKLEDSQLLLMQLRWHERQELEHIKFLILVHSLFKNVDVARSLLADYFELYSGQKVEKVDPNDPMSGLSEEGKKFLEQLNSSPEEIDKLFNNES